MKCNKCHRSEHCKLRVHAMESQPWIKKALDKEDEWDKVHAVKRAMRGVGGGPGFIDDWIYEQVILRYEVEDIIKEIIKTGKVDMNLFFEKCRYYKGFIGGE